MAIQALTLRNVETLKPQAKRYGVFDASLSGLAIRATPSEHKAWVLHLFLSLMRGARME